MGAHGHVHVGVGSLGFSLSVVTAAVCLAGLSASGQDRNSPPSLRQSTPAADRAPAEEALPDTEAAKLAEERAFRLHDGFDRRLELNWDVIRPNPAKVSLAKNPGRLTITSELGGLHAANRTGNLAKNVYMIPNPAGGAGDFVVTTCIEGFAPQTSYQQAGPHVYDDDDNYLKAVIARNPSGVVLSSAWEANGVLGGQDLSVTGLEWDRLWLRITKRGRAYESAYSTDGKTYTVFAEHVWGTGAPERVGLAVMNEDRIPDPLDAAFDFFEVRSLTPEEANDPLSRERHEIQGLWEVISCELDGRALEESPFSRLVFEGLEMTVTEKEESITTRYALNVDKEPKELAFSKVPGRAMTAVYRQEQNRLLICMDPRPGAPAPAELEAVEGDGYLLVGLRRMPAVQAAALDRNAKRRSDYFRTLDADGDRHLTLVELLVDYPAPDAVRQGTELFEALDANLDGKLSFDEFGGKPRTALFLGMDLDADGSLTFDEFYNGEMPSAAQPRVQRIFGVTDRNGDRRVSYEEFHDRPREAWFHIIDLDGDGEMSLEEFRRDNPRLAHRGIDREAFATLDRNKDDRVQLAEYCQRVWNPQAAFEGLDRDRDGALVLVEFTPRGGDRTDVKKAADVFAITDRDRDGKLTPEEFAKRPREAIFREYDHDGDGGLDLKEFHAADMKGASAARVRRAFALVDGSGDGKVAFDEFYGRPKEAWFHRMDTDEDGRMSMAEYSRGTPELVRSGHARRAFGVLDRNGDRALDAAEYCRKSVELGFLTCDADGDGQIRFEEFSAWCATEEATAAAKEDFARRDADGTGQLSLQEYSGRND